MHEEQQTDVGACSDPKGKKVVEPLTPEALSLRGMTLLHEGDTLVLKHKWNTAVAFTVWIILGFVALFVCFISYVTGAAAALGPIIRENPLPFLAGFSPVLLLLAWLNYLALCYKKNSTIYRIGHGKLTIGNEPLPYRKGCSIDTNEILRLFVRDVQKTDTEGDPYFRYDLCIELKNGRCLRPVNELEIKEDAEILRQIFEARLLVEKIG